MILRKGVVLDGRYRVGEPLGRGAMAEVWSAHDAVDHRDVAIKALNPSAAASPELTARFEREARAVARIDSPRVLRLLASGAAGSARYLVFERLVGEPLDAVLKREKVLAPRAVAVLLEDLFEGARAAHAASVIHRDLKPSNVFLEAGGRAKLLDFGVSKLEGDAALGDALTRTDATVGSLAFMAPEQVDGAREADERADLYAIATIGYRALTGTMPFDAKSLPVVVALKISHDARSLAEATGTPWPAEVEALFRRGLARDRGARWASASEALRDLARVSGVMSSLAVVRRRAVSAEPDDDRTETAPAARKGR